MRINLKQIQSDFDVCPDKFTKVIIGAHNDFETVDECKPQLYEKEGDCIYIPNNFIFLMFESRSVSGLPDALNILVTAKDTDGDTVTRQVCCTDYAVDSCAIYRAIKDTLEDMDAEYSENVSSFTVKNILKALPYDAVKGLSRHERLYDKFDRVVR